MGLIKNKEGRNISVAVKNGYSLEKVRLAKKYIDEIGHNRRNFPLEKLIEYYNTIKNTNAVINGCRPCQATKYYNGILNYYQYGKLTLLANGLATEDEIDNWKDEVEESPQEEVIDKVDEVKVIKKSIKRAKKVNNDKVNN